MIGIVDYGLGNIRAFENIYRRLGIPAIPVKTAEDLVQADHLILPGVGAFDWAMNSLSRSGMLESLNRRVLVDRVPILGVCVGMQIMADQSAEGNLPGLGWIPGHVERFEDRWFNQRTHLPHMGWNTVTPRADEALFDGIEFPQYYFLHSYFFNVSEAEHVVARSFYGIEFACAVRNQNIWATQFHPEKSHDWGVNLLSNFAKIH